MKYKIVAYAIRFYDGREQKGIAPYCGESIEPDIIKAFISQRIFQLNSSWEEIAVDVICRYVSEHEWIISVHQLELFRILYWREGFGKELLEKYELPIPAPLTGYNDGKKAI